MPIETLDGLPPEIFAYGFSVRKRPIMRRFAGGSKVRFVGDGRCVPPDGTLLLWGNGAAPPGLAENVRLIRVEDGFLRSVGLGADLVRPLSWVMDSHGIYYDATRPSGLEIILQNKEFTPGLLERASRLRRRIVETGLTKYNVGGATWTRPAGNRRVILVPGQVESDASVRFGAPRVRTNARLLRSVREANLDAYIIYKPHPDVEAGLRARGLGEDEARLWCNEVVFSDVRMGQLLNAVDEVHVMTSLTGFEALMRGRKVVCYGQPFYSGWGLTTDMAPVPRRTRKLSLDMLVAGALILYPVYVDRVGLPSSPEQTLDELVSLRKASASSCGLRKTLLRWTLRLMVGPT